MSKTLIVTLSFTVRGVPIVCSIIGTTITIGKSVGKFAAISFNFEYYINRRYYYLSKICWFIHQYTNKINRRELGFQTYLHQ